MTRIDPNSGGGTRRSRSGDSLIERAAEAFSLAPRPLPPAAEAVPPASSAVPVPLVPAHREVAPPRASVPHRRGTLDRAALAANGLLDPAAPPGVLAEEFRAIKRPILLDAFGARGHAAAERGRMVMVGSARPGDGKSFCAANLALSLASEKDIAVLLVDADFAKPSVPRLLGLDMPGEGGLLDGLRDGTDLEGAIVDTDVPGLSVLPAGTAGRDDTELLTSDRAAAALDQLMAADPRRVIVFDTPPVLVASPARVLAVHVGQILLVVRADRTREQDVADAVEAFDGAAAKLHLMLNAVSFKAPGERYGSYYGTGQTG